MCLWFIVCCRLDRVGVSVYVCVRSYMCSCAVSVISYAMLYDVFLVCCVCVCLLFNVIGCRACEVLCDDACWIMCVIVSKCLFNEFVWFVCGLWCDVVLSVVVCVLLFCVCLFGECVVCDVLCDVVWFVCCCGCVFA